MDILHDASNREWYQMGTRFQTLIPDYVLTSEWPTKEAADGLPDRLFADEILRLYPLDTQAATWLSAAYFAKNAGARDKDINAAIERRILKAADVFGITKDVQAIMQAIRAPVAEKQAADDDSNYGFVAQGTRIYPMFDARGVTKASEYFTVNRFHYPSEMRKTLACNIMRKAAEHKVEVSDVVRREAGHGYPRRDTLMAEMLARAELCKDAEVAMAVANINEMIATADAQELQEVLEKVAAVIDEMDRLEGLDRHYGKRVLAPADFLYDLDPKEAEALALDSIELGQHIFSLQKLAELPKSVFANVLGEDFVNRVKTAEGTIDLTKFENELSSMPRPDKAALDSYLQTL